MSQIPAPVFPSPPQVYPQSNFALQSTTIKNGVDKNGNPKTIQVNLVALQFVYLAYSTWSVAMTTQLTGRMDAIRGFFVDNTNCMNDIIIVNITFGFQVRVPARSSGFYPFLAPPGDLTFYLYNTGGTSATDSSNVYVLDTTPDPANYPEYQRVLSYGVGATGNFVPVYGSTDIHGNPVPQIVANQTIRTGLLNMGNFPLSPTPGTNEYISTDNWYIESLYLWFGSQGNASANLPYGIILYDGTTPFFDLYTLFTGYGSNPANWSISDLKYKSLGTGAFYICGTQPGATEVYVAINLSVSY